MMICRQAIIRINDDVFFWPTKIYLGKMFVKNIEENTFDNTACKMVAIFLRLMFLNYVPK